MMKVRKLITRSSTTIQSNRRMMKGIMALAERGVGS
jgi:hypothetical protein